VYVDGTLSVWGLGFYIGIQILAGGLFWCVVPAGRGPIRTVTVGFLAVLVAGFGLRMASFSFAPAKESDYYRYMWDGAVTAHGMNPYRHAPGDVLDAVEELEQRGDPLQDGFNGVFRDVDRSGPDVSTERLLLAERGREVLERVNAMEVRTIYPPAAQACFAVAYLISPFQTFGLRVLYLLFDLIGLVLVLCLCRTLRTSVMAAGLYWLNPLVIRQVYQGLHMDVLLFPLLLVALYLAARERVVGSLVALIVAIGIKIWPVILLPLFFSYFRHHRRILLGSTPVLVLGMLLLFSPMGIDPFAPEAGWVAFGRHWRTNAGLFSVFLRMGRWILSWMDRSREVAALLARGLSGFSILGTIAWFATRKMESVRDLIQSGFWTVFWTFMLLPMQFPWYALWLVPFLTFYPVSPGLLIILLLPIYDSQIWFLVENRRAVFEYGVVWLQWGPVLAGVIYHAYRTQTDETDKIF